MGCLNDTQGNPTNVDEILMKKKTGQSFMALTSTFSVELPGIEPGLKCQLNCRNLGSDDAKAPESTQNDLRKHGRC